jgi:hypothetical protein
MWQSVAANLAHAIAPLMPFPNQLVVIQPLTHIGTGLDYHLGGFESEMKTIIEGGGGND